MRRHAWIPILLLALGACGEKNKGAKGPDLIAARTVDKRNMKTIVDVLVLSLGRLPMKDGALDVYYLVGKGEIQQANFDLFRSARLGTGPTDAEIGSGDYTNFPWERYRGKRQLNEGRPFPLLWEKTPDGEGNYLVALSDGSVVSWDRVRLDDAISLAR